MKVPRFCEFVEYILQVLLVTRRLAHVTWAAKTGGMGTCVTYSAQMFALRVNETQVNVSLAYQKDTVKIAKASVAQTVRQPWRTVLPAFTAIKTREIAGNLLASRGIGIHGA